MSADGVKRYLGVYIDSVRSTAQRPGTGCATGLGALALFELLKLLQIVGTSQQPILQSRTLSAVVHPLDARMDLGVPRTFPQLIMIS